MKFLVFLISSLIINVGAIASTGAPQEWQMGLQKAASPVMEKLNSFHDVLLVMCVAIVGLVFFLLAYVIIRFNKKANPVPSKTSHNVLIEIIWTVIPVLILIAIAIPSFKLLFYLDREPSTDMTIKVVGQQWYWKYQYPDHGNFEFDSYMIKDEDIKDGQLRLLEVDNRIVLPVNKNVKVLITGGDVIHSWAVPALGIKTDAVPGRINETWLRITEPGVYYGQCSEICGVGHGFMPIAIEAVTQDKFDRWAAIAKKKFS
ncbi:MAG: cytochrome c oxidase subunit II [Rickettsiales bacterium]